jgi:branched-chain amino acid transport system permease protein
VRPLLPALAIIALQLVFFRLPAGLFVQGLIVGGLTSLVALGMALTYRSNRILNFAHADMGTTPLVLSALLVAEWHWPWLVAVLVGCAAALVLGGIVEVAIIRRFASAPRLLLTVATIGLGQLLYSGGLILPRAFGRGPVDQLTLPAPFQFRMEIAGTIFRAYALLAFIVVPVATIALTYFLRRTHVGVAVRASADRSDRATSLGIPVKRLQTVVWAIAALLSFGAVFLRSGLPGSPGATAFSFAILLRAMAALLIGRMTQLTTIATTAIAFGVLEQGVGQNASPHRPPIDAVLAVVVIVALALQRRQLSRVAIDDSSSWRSSEDVRPVPKAIARVPMVKVIRWSGYAVLGAVALVLPHLLSIDRQFKAEALLVYALLCLSVVVLTGWSGQVSLGQIAFFALGAALGGKATTAWHLDLTLAMGLAAVAGGVAAVVIGLPAVRLRGFYLAVTTFAIALATTNYFLNRSYDIGKWVPRGRVARPVLFGKIDLDSQIAFYYVVLAILLVVLWGLRGVRNSRTGRAMLAVRDNERAAQAYSISVTRLRLTAFALSGAIASLAGCLLVHVSGGFDSQPYSAGENLTVFSMAVVGGVASPAGAVLGALYVQGTRWFLPVEWQLLSSGIGILLVLLILPGGLGGLALRLRDRLYERVARKEGIDAAGLAQQRLDLEPASVVDAADHMAEVEA